MAERGDEKLDAVIAEFLEASERGAEIDREAVMIKHPDLAAELKEFFANHDAMMLAAIPDTASRRADAMLQSAEISAANEAPTFTSPPSSTSHFAAREQFGEYELLEEIARGGMGIVFRAR